MGRLARGVGDWVPRSGHSRGLCTRASRRAHLLSLPPRLPPAPRSPPGISSVACSALSLRVAARRTAGFLQASHLQSRRAALRPPLGPDSRESSLGHPCTFPDSAGNWEEVPESRDAQTRHANLAPARRKCAGAATLLLFLVPLPTSGCRVLCRAGPSGD